MEQCNPLGLIIESLKPHHFFQLLSARSHKDFRFQQFYITVVLKQNNPYPLIIVLSVVNLVCLSVFSHANY